MKKEIYLLNAFSLQMLSEMPANIKIEEVEASEIYSHYAILEDGGMVFGNDIEKYQNYVVEYGRHPHNYIKSAIGHQDTAAVLDVPMNRINVSLKKGDVAYVAQLQGGRLPEGSTELPEGFSFKFLRVIIQ